MPLRICLTGVESTGKSTLAARLAKRFDGVVMPEYGREWAETRGTDFTTVALREIARRHAALRQELEAKGPRLIIEDTDIVTTSAWHRMLWGRRDPVLWDMPATADLYLLFAPDTVWVDDGTRRFGGTDRIRFHDALVYELSMRGISPVIIEGDWRQREADAVAAIAALLDRQPAA